MISTHERSDDWIAFLTDDPAVWEAGETEAQAITKMIVTLQARQDGSFEKWLGETIGRNLYLERVYAQVKEACDAVGIGLSIKVLVRHHRANAAAAAGADLMGEGWISDRSVRDLQQTLRTIAASVEDNRREPDKILCCAQSLRHAALAIEPPTQRGED